jgi:hypothetical protein
MRRKKKSREIKEMFLQMSFLNPVRMLLPKLISKRIRKKLKRQMFRFCSMLK